MKKLFFIVLMIVGILFIPAMEVVADDEPAPVGIIEVVDAPVAQPETEAVTNQPGVEKSDGSSMLWNFFLTLWSVIVID